jgi:hypothetical protein
MITINIPKHRDSRSNNYELKDNRKSNIADILIDYTI